jgi:hypothetical protein
MTAAVYGWGNSGGRNGAVEWWRTGVVENWSGGELEWWRTGVVENWSDGELE